MRLEALRLLADWFGNATYGVNAHIPGVTRSGGDAEPAAFALIADATENAFAARGQFPQADASYPCLLLRLGQSTAVESHAKCGVRDGEVEILLAYADLNSDSVAGLRNAEYRLRAIERSFEDWWTQGAASDRLMNGVVAWYAASPLAVVDPFVPVEDKTITGGLRVTLKMRDTAP